ncbi:MAG: hypothetical protein AB4426_33040 [Xenococcaceae cyanobacterium]
MRFRFNKVTGEVEVFEVTDEGTMRLSEAEHNRQHDLIAAELGNVIERNPRIMEVFPTNIEPIVGAIPEQPNTDESLSSSETQDQKEKQNE